MADNVSLIVNETIDNVVVNPSITTEVIDVNVTGTDTYVDISVTPNVTIVNINEVTGSGGGGGSQDLQSVLEYGNTATAISLNLIGEEESVCIYANSPLATNGVINITTSGSDSPIATGCGIKINATTGQAIQAFSDYNIDETNVINDTIYCQNYSTKDLDFLYDASGITVQTTDADGIRTYTNTGIGVLISQGSTGSGLIISSGTSSTGAPIAFFKNGVNKFFVSQAGELTATKLIKQNGTASELLMADGTTTPISNINSKQLQLNYLDSDNAIFNAFYLRTISDSGAVEASNQLLSSLAVLRNISYVSQGYTQQINADKFVKLGGAADEFLMADGSISFGGGGGGGATNLTTSQTSTNFTINSNTGTDATVPLGNGTLAGATLNDYTSAEKALVATIPNINTNAVNRDTVKLAEAINKGQAVYVSGASGTNILVSKASNISEALSSKTFGLLETTGVLNDIVNVITAGLFSGLNTSTATIGDAVWLGTAGNLIFGLANKPVSPAHLVYIGIVTRVSATVGEIFVSIQNGFELSEIHDILINGTLANEDFLQYESSTSLWKNKQLTDTLIKSKLGITTLSGSNTGDQTLSGLGGVASNTAITGATNTKITYDAKGLVTAGTTLIASDIPNIAQSQVTNLTTDLAGKQDKSLVAYNMVANNTASAANATGFAFRKWDLATYGGTIAWTPSGTPPTTILGQSYGGQQVGNMVSINIAVVYSNAGTSNTQVLLSLPSDFPTPVSPTGFTAALDVIAYGTGMIMNATNSTAVTGARNCFLRRNAANNGYEFFLNVSVSVAAKVAILNLTYQTS